MKQTLQLRLSQHLAMTPRLQQAIRLLQLSTMELHAEVQDALDSNLMLELDEDDASSTGTEAEVAPADIPHELPVDSAWEDIYDPAPVNNVSSYGEFNGTDLVAHHARTESLKDRLHWQTSLMRLSDTDRVIAAALIDAVDEDGYLTLSLEDIRQSLDPRRREVTLEQTEAVLGQIQNLEPSGVAARDLSECLAIQLRQLSAGTEWRDAALTLVTEHLQALASRNYGQLMTVLGLGKRELQCVIDLIRSLSPRPGAMVVSSEPEYVIPDVFVRRESGAWKVELNPDTLPKLRINSRYENLIRRADNSADNHTLKNHLQEARWFIKSLVNRGETLLKTATCIVERQKAFLEHGEEAMRPMVLADIAETIGMHESTISRVTTRKYMHTPRGLFELKYFFSSHVRTVNGAEASSTAIRAVLRKLIASENPARPLSDQKLKDVLSEQGIRIARRTVAKYREAMAIPSSTERKAL
ncbi:MAG: RNA polymerase factor sigma-54 [Gammaproteobacteria bacterium]|nr:RNA polymerase factor sigma-54 [Gammaproteobacteria bacterium]